MPRIELIPANFDSTTGDGSPTIDVCKDDCGDFVIADVYESEDYGKCEVGSTEVAHPSYNDDVYKCVICGKRLTEEEDA